MKTFRYSIVLVVLALLASGVQNAAAQRVNFAVNAQEGITVQTIGGLDVLNFNEAGENRFITPNSPARIITPQLREGDGVVVIEITARADLEITVTVTAPDVLTLEGATGDNPPQIPFQLGWSYWNLAQGKGPGFTAPAPLNAPVRGSLREVKSPAMGGLNFSTATFPVRRRQLGAGGPPPPPPTPRFGEAPEYPMTTVYVFLYGTMGAIPTNAASGQYSANLIVEVSYAS